MTVGSDWLKPLITVDSEMARIAELLAGPPLTAQEEADHLARVQAQKSDRQGVLPL